MRRCIIKLYIKYNNYNINANYNYFQLSIRACILMIIFIYLCLWHVFGQRSVTCCRDHHVAIQAAFRGQFGCVRCRCFVTLAALEEYNAMLPLVEEALDRGDGMYVCEK